MRIGSKAFPESVILGEMIRHLVASSGADAEHRRALGGTRVLWEALTTGEIDVYAEYTGTISNEILAGSGVQGEEALRQALAKRGISMSRSLGFNDAYAIGMKKDVASELGIKRISDLRAHRNLKFGFSSEFMKRADGWPGLLQRYQLPQRDVSGLEHALTYASLRAGRIQATDLYLTDPELLAGDIGVLVDDRGLFPAYHAVLLYRSDLPDRAPEAVTAILKLEGQINEEQMQRMNARAKFEGMAESEIAADYLADRLGLHVQVRGESAAEQILEHTRKHLYLVVASLLAAIVIAVPLGVVAARWPTSGQAILGSVGIVQTIPSIVLLVFMIPLLGIGAKPAIIALFLYSLLPIVRNTFAGLHDIPGSIRESATALGLSDLARLRLVELPLAARSILAGIKTAAVINVGTATLGGFIGAGGYGELIFTGIYLNNTGRILQGAIPAALLALLVQSLFELAERAVVPKGLRLKPAE